METNGLPSRDTQNGSVQDNFMEWPRIWQIGWLLATDGGEEIAHGVHYLLPPFESGEWEKDPDHPYEIDLQSCLMIGEDQNICFPDISRKMIAADLIVCHNLQFDSRVFEAEMYRIRENYDTLTPMPPKKSEGKDKLCTMMKSAKLCNLPHKSGSGFGKWPSLEELNLHLFGEPNEGAHNALSDVKATARCFFELRRLGIIPESL